MSIQLIPLENGWMSCDTSMMCENADGRSRFPVSSWVVKHPLGLVLFDAGFHPSLLSDTSRLGPTATVFDIEMKKDLATVLKDSEIDVADISFLVLSHLHFDHCGGVVQIPNAQIVVQQDEWQSGHDEKRIEMGIYNPDDFDLGHDIKQVQGQYDIFGDGSVQCIPTPGHTAGHQSLKVELDSGPVVLTSDCAYWQLMLDEMLLPPHGYDREQQKRSMQSLSKLQAQGCRLIFGHDAAQWLSIDHQPLT